MRGALIDATLPVVMRRTCVCPSRLFSAAMKFLAMQVEVRTNRWVTGSLILVLVFFLITSRPEYSLAIWTLMRRERSRLVTTLSSALDISSKWYRRFAEVPGTCGGTTRRRLSLGLSSTQFTLIYLPELAAMCARL